MLRNLALHFRPTTIPRETLRLSLSWGLGGMAATLVCLQLGSGILLKFMYEPSPVTAFVSIQSMIDQAPFGRLIHNLHHWCAHLLVAVILLHMLRVFFTGAYHPPRQFNWIVGLGAFAVVLGTNFTGYLLPWDQLAFWAVTVSTGMLEYIPLIGGHIREMILDSGEIGPRTLQIFFALHTAVLPVLLVLLMAFHFWRVRKAGGLVIPRRANQGVKENPARAPAVPDLLLRETATALSLIAAVLLLSTVIDAPLGDPANPGLSPSPIRAPWYFAGLQELLLHLHPVFAVFVIPIIVSAGMMAIPYLTYETDTGGIWFASRIGRQTAGLAAITGIIATPLLVLADTWLSAADSPVGSLAPAVGNGWIPTLVLIVAVGGFYVVTKRYRGAGNNEAVQSVFTLLFTTYAMLTAISLWLRGEGMVLRLPW